MILVTCWNEIHLQGCILMDIQTVARHCGTLRSANTFALFSNNLKDNCNKRNFPQGIKKAFWLSRFMVQGSCKWCSCR